MPPTVELHGYEVWPEGDPLDVWQYRTDTAGNAAIARAGEDWGNDEWRFFVRQISEGDEVHPAELYCVALVYQVQKVPQ